MKTNLTLNNTGYIAEKPVTMRKSGILDPTKYESRGAALTALGMVRRRRRSPDMGTVPLTLTQGKFAVIDEQDLLKVSAYRWRARKLGNSWYALGRRRREDGTSEEVMLHRVVMDAPKGVMIDHRNGDGLDCRHENLRYASRRENALNRGRQANNASGYKGVSWHRGNQKWQAIIDRRCIGYFDDPADAARAYDAEAIRLHGEFARTNAAMGLLPEGTE